MAKKGGERGTERAAPDLDTGALAATRYLLGERLKGAGGKERCVMCMGKGVVRSEWDQAESGAGKLWLKESPSLRREREEELMEDG